MLKKFTLLSIKCESKAFKRHCPWSPNMTTHSQAKSGQRRSSLHTKMVMAALGQGGVDSGQGMKGSNQNLMLVALFGGKCSKK